jgi:hypothetical protein
MAITNMLRGVYALDVRAKHQGSQTPLNMSSLHFYQQQIEPPDYTGILADDL